MQISLKNLWTASIFRTFVWLQCSSKTEKHFTSLLLAVWGATSACSSTQFQAIGFLLLAKIRTEQALKLEHRQVKCRTCYRRGKSRIHVTMDRRPGLQKLLWKHLVRFIHAKEHTLEARPFTWGEKWRAHSLPFFEVCVFRRPSHSEKATALNYQSGQESARISARLHKAAS